MKIYFFYVDNKVVLAKAKNLALARKKVRAKYPASIRVYYYMNIDEEELLS